jgi:hypothetical protein
MAAQPKPLPVEVPSYYEGGGILGWLTTIDHKRIAVMYGAAALFFLVVGGVEALLIRLQLWAPGMHVLSASTYNEVFTMHGTTMVFLVVMPLEIGFLANFFLPLQLGARDVAFPRLNAMSLWIFLGGAVFLHLGWIFWGGVPNAGWFGYANLTERMYTPGLHIDFWVLGLLILGISTVLTGLNFLVTIVTMRSRGMSYMRMPMFVWAMLVTSVLILIAFPALTVGLIFLAADPVAAPFLALWPSRSVHHGAARLRNGLRDHPGVLAQGSVRLPDDGVLAHPDRLPVLWRVGPPHVCHGHGAGGGQRIRDHLDADRDTDRDQDIQLDRDRVGRAAPLHDAVPVCARHDPRVHDRRAVGSHARERPG